MANENFYESAIRHWMDSCILKEREEYDNAVCMQGFSAECALKAIMQVILENQDVKKYQHFGEALFQDIIMIISADLNLPAMISAAWGLRLSSLSLPEILFQNHPERRYYSDGVYSEDDADACQDAAEVLIREMLSMRLDGYL